MKQIRLTKGQVALVDDEDFDWLNQWRWKSHKITRGETSYFYAMRIVKNNGKRTYQTMHRLILGLAHSSPEVDHRNHNTLDNRRCNLRIATVIQNQGNSRKRAGCTSQYKGVCFVKGKWRSAIRINRRVTYLGSFTSEVDAAICYAEAAHQHFGEFAHTPGLLNFG